MKYIKHYESTGDSEDILRYNFHYTKECVELLCDLILKFGIKFFVSDKMDVVVQVGSDSEDVGFIRISNDSVKYAIPATEENYSYIGNQNFEKYGFWIEDGNITFTTFTQDSIVYLRKPVEEIYRRGGYTRKNLRFLSNKKYKTFAIGKGTKSYFNISDGIKMINNIKNFAIKSIKNPDILYNAGPIMLQINK